MTFEVHTLTPVIATLLFLVVVGSVLWAMLRGSFAATVSFAASPRELGAPLTDAAAEPAALLGALIVRQESWVHRRVESFQLLDDATVRRRVSIDFTLPSSLTGEPRSDPDLTTLGAIPLTLLRKRPLRNFDLHDEQGVTLPLLTRRENADLAGNLLVSAAETVLERAVPERIRRDLRQLTRCSASEGELRLKQWRHTATTASAADHPLWATLLAAPDFEDLLAAFARNYVLLAAVTPVAGRRRILKFSYEEAYRLFGNRWERALASLGWRPAIILVDAPGASAAASYHLEIAAPDALSFGQAKLIFLGEPDAARAPVVDREAANRAHLYASDVDQQFEAEGRIAVVPRAEGLVRAGLFTSLLVVGLLTGGLLNLDELQSDVQASTALLLIVPTVLVAYLVRPGEHALTSRLLVGVRILLVLAATASVAMAGALAIKLDDSTLKVAWIGALGLAGASCLGLAASNVLALATARRR